ncbi:MAG TPA: 2-oxo-4-hydroxy-4-carboxy-5-ureidoimidazoline decarboxylase [Vicinamibacterales bacterium]|nr:2-oxo-4-hydroxy-4-carboxy-5-ureidoimidazoline decarboxylase [Vicinamibacterales bacterium]
MARLRVDAAPPGEARELLRACCGSRRWVEAMLARRPFGTLDALLAAARDAWFALDRADWLEAFADHPRIGDREALTQRFPETRHLASREQAGVDGASDDVLTALAEGNEAYEGRFGYIFIVCATGLTAQQMLAMLRRRLENDPLTELRVAAEEQAKITALRLRKLSDVPA